MIQLALITQALVVGQEKGAPSASRALDSGKDVQVSDHPPFQSEKQQVGFPTGFGDSELHLGRFRQHNAQILNYFSHPVLHRTQHYFELRM